MIDVNRRSGRLGPATCQPEPPRTNRQRSIDVQVQLLCSRPQCDDWSAHYKNVPSTASLQCVMEKDAPVTPNRRGLRSRELVLDAAESVMASEGFEAATLGRVVEESGVPLSSVYHYFGSKTGLLLAVMQRGAERYFAEVPDYDRRSRSAVEHLRTVVSTAVEALERRPHFLRLLIVFAVQPPQVGRVEVTEVVRQVRRTALDRLRRQLALAFDDDPRSRDADRVARLALAAIDGAFVASSVDRSITLSHVLAPLPDALVAARRSLRVKAGTT